MVLFFRHRFHKPPFSAIHTRNGAFSKGSIFETVYEISVFINVFGRFSVDDRRKCIKKYAFSFENGLVWSGPKITKSSETKPAPVT